MIKTEIVCDSINTIGNRLTTFVLEYPRFCHAELMTHRMFSKNAASSRAIPIEKMIEQIKINPAMPVWWGKNQSGMQAKEELDNTLKKHFTSDFYCQESFTDKEMAKKLWLESRDKAIEQVLKLNEIGLHKQIANRILEPWFNIRIILSGTEFQNFFALRVHEDAQPEIRELATQMLKLYNESTPKRLSPGEWHIPFGDKIDESRLITDLGTLNKDSEGTTWAPSPKQIKEGKIKIAVARCARVSYFNFDGKDDYLADMKLCDRLFGNIPKHLSPTEHVAKALSNSEWSGNFCGFKQYRKMFIDENLKDGRVLPK